jgi:hypothetical protein
MGTKKQVAERVEAIARLCLEGKGYREIAEFCGKNGWPTCPSQVYVYIRRADALIARHVETNRNSLFGQRIARRNALWARAVEKGDLATALKVEESQTALLGFGLKPNQASRTTQVQVNNVIPSMCAEEREELCRMCLARLGRADPPKDRIGQPAPDGQVSPRPGADPQRRGG